MSKFKMDTFRSTLQKQENQTASIYGNGESAEKRIKVGSGLLGAIGADKSGIEKMRDVEVPYEQIKTSEKNEWSMNDSSIRELADLIKDVGLLNRLILKKTEDDHYEIVCGERRYRAIGMLREKHEWSKEEPVPARLFEPELVRLELSDEMKEDYVRLAENDGQRNKTDGDTYIKIREYKKIYAALREAGELSGVKTRKLLAEDTKLSESKIEQFQRVENRGSQTLQDALLNNDITASTAVEVTNLPKEKQEEFIEKVKAEKKPGESITKDDLRKFTHEQNHPPMAEEESSVSEESEEAGEEVSGRLLSVDDFKKDIKPVIRGLREKKVHLDEKQYESYLRCIERLIDLVD